MAQTTTAVDTTLPRRNTRNIVVSDQEKVPPNVMNAIIKGAVLNVFIPTIPEVQETNILQQFKIKALTEIEGRTSYNAIKFCERELGRNALAIKVPFGGGKRDRLGLIYSNERYKEEEGDEMGGP